MNKCARDMKIDVNGGRNRERKKILLISKYDFDFEMNILIICLYVKLYKYFILLIFILSFNIFVDKNRFVKKKSDDLKSNMEKKTKMRHFP